MNLRRAELQDFEQVGKLLQQLNPGDPEFTDLTLNVYKQIIDDPFLILLVAEENEQLTGSAYLNIIPNLSQGGRSYAVVENVIVAKEYRQRGIGRALMEKVIELAWKAGCYKLMLLTGRKSAAVHGLYKKLGFSADSKQAYILRSEDSLPSHD